MYFNIEINILDQYSFECEKVHMLVFINYWIEKCTVKHWIYYCVVFIVYSNICHEVNDVTNIFFLLEEPEEKTPFW